MTDKSLESLVAFAKSDLGSKARGLVNCIRNTEDPYETWKWLQGLMLDRSNTTVDIGNLIHKQEPFSSTYSVPASLYVPLGTVRRDLMKVSFTKSELTIKHHKRRLSKESSLVTSPQSSKTSSKEEGARMRERILQALDLGLSKSVLASVVSEIVKQD